MRHLFKTLFFFVLLLSCNKDSSEPPSGSPNPAIDLVMINTSAIPGQIVLAQASHPIPKDSAIISVSGKSVYAFKADSNRVAFLMPELTAGSTAAIDFKNIGINKQLNIAVLTYTPIAQADPVIDSFVLQMNQIIINYEEYMNNSLIPLDASYVNMMKYCRNSFTAKVNTLSPSQKKELAYTLKAYALNPAESKLDSLNPNFFARSLQTLGDPEDEFKKNSSLLLTRVIKAKVQVSLGLAIMVGSIGAGPAGTVTALAGAYIFLDGVKKMTDAQADSYSKSVNSVAIKTTGINVQRVAADTLVLAKDVQRRITSKGTFRTIAQGDLLLTVPIMNDFKEGKSTLDACHSLALSAFEKFKQIVGGTAPVFPSSNAALSSVSKSKQVTMQASKLSVINISNPAINVTYVREDTTLLIKASSTTINQTTPFQFDLVYTNSSTGTTISDKINAMYKVREPALLTIKSGNNQTAPPTFSLNDPLTIEVRDDSGSLMPAVQVQWQVTSGGGLLLQSTTTTGATGQSTNGWQLGATGTQLVTATVRKPNGSHVIGSPATFIATIKEPNSLSYVSGNNQAASPGTNLASPLVVAVKDVNGQPMSGITVYWTVLSGGGQLGNATTLTTLPSGQSSNTLKLGTSGVQTVSAVVRKSDGTQVSGSPFTFTATLTGVGTTLFTARPGYIALDVNGNVYVSEENNHRILKWTPGASNATVVAGGNGQGNGANQLYWPKGIDIDASGNLYIADYGNNRIQKWAPGATSGTTIVNSYSAVVGGIFRPQEVQVGSGGMLYILLNQFNGSLYPLVEKRMPGASSGTVVLTTTAGTNSELKIFLDGSDNLYLSDGGNQKVTKHSPTGVVTTVAGGNGTGSAANQFSVAKGIFVDASGNLYVVDYSNFRIQKWAPGASSGVTVAGGNGNGTAANQVNEPVDVYLDGSGRLYIAELNRVTKW